MLTDWEKMWLNMAIAASKKSKDPSTQVGAVIVSPDRRSITAGFNGFPEHCLDEVAVLNKSAGYTITNNVIAKVPFKEAVVNKYDLVLHAEQNAILNCRTRPVGYTLYCTHVPCAACSSFIAGSGITNVVAIRAFGASDMGYEKTEIIFKLNKINFKLCTLNDLK